MTSIFFLTSIFNNSIHSTFAVDEVNHCRFHEKWKRENKTMVAKKAAKKPAKKGGKKK
jgi:hypothetical protein